LGNEGDLEGSGADSTVRSVTTLRTALDLRTRDCKKAQSLLERGKISFRGFLRGGRETQKR